MQRLVAVFGNGSTGSSYALWLARGSSPDDCPVVLLGSEGEFLALANTPLEFCQLLGCGYDELEWDNLEATPQCWQQTAALREWLKDRLGVESPETGHNIATAARVAHPDFEHWVTEWQRLHR